MYATYRDLKDKGVFITGGGSGIGADLVSAFVAQGAKVGFVDIDVKASQKLCDDLEESHGVRPVFKEFDITQLDQIADLMAEFRQDLGPIEVLVNNAASDTRHAMEEINADFWHNRLDVNISHQLFCAKAVKEDMIAQGNGAIINFGSISYQVALENLIPYQTSKAAVVGLTRALARDLGKHNIRVNNIMPGCILTPKQLELWITPEDEAAIQERQCLKRRLIGEDVANMALFLASKSSSACTAQSFIVDGGYI